MAFAVAVGFAIFFAGAFLIPHGRGIRFQLFVLAGYPVYLLIILLETRFNKYIPRKLGVSREKLYLQYRKKLESYRWNEISRIYFQRTRGSTKLVIESVGGEVTPIAFLLKDERERIIDYYENLKKLNKPV
ncbi:MAG: hypothetical protein E3J35_07035 [Methanomassiliicoccales archaeon]|nr:MAG: hypothetical protein E3J35_07035 [Methanomassiliicoccales archaeon]